MQQQLHGFDQSRNFQHPYVSNTQDYSALVSVQESELKNHLMQRQKELHGFDQNTVPGVFCSDFQKNPCGDMVASTSFSQDCPNMLSSNGESSLLQTSSLPYLHAIPKTYWLPENSRIL
ncbi:unnamed protein product [Arabis nemorensis]|uniref:Uncharacterized protein n=1 Tax=Arabis nemorensis TaxID=586526 RepID=A0A565CX09_9BRAS|nr:unnamed protein product [Arabis nemorensis]